MYTIISVRPAYLHGKYVIVVTDGHDGLSVLDVDKAQEILGVNFFYDGNAGFDVCYEKLSKNEKAAIDQSVDFAIDPDDLPLKGLKYARSVEDDKYPNNGYALHPSMLALSEQ